MTKTIWTGTCAAVVSLSTAIIVAQAPAPTPQQDRSSTSDQRITVTGCLKAAPPSSSETTGASGAVGTSGAAGGATTGAADATDAAKFLLTDVAMTPAADTAGAAGAAGAATESTPPPSGSSAKTYRLVANPAALSPHVGKKLELTGTLDQSSATAPAGSSGAGPDANAPALKVESGKVVAQTCER